MTQGITDIAEEITTLFRAKYPVLYLVSSEEDRAIKMLSQIAKTEQKELLCWSVTEGLRDKKRNPVGSMTIQPEVAMEAIKNYDKAAIVVFKDLNYALTGTNPIPTRKLRDLHHQLCGSKKNLVLLSPVLTIPPELEASVTVLDMPLPTENELREIFEDTLAELRERAEDEDSVAEALKLVEPQLIHKDKIVQAGRGMTSLGFENAIAKGFVSHNMSVELINNEKSQIIKKSKVLEIHEPSENIGEVGGLDLLKDWVRMAVKRNTKEAKDYGLEMPKSVLLVGPPGTGKSLMAKVIAKEMQQPLLQMDMSNISSKLYGQTTVNIKTVIRVASAVSPCVLWMDEFEKQFQMDSIGGMHEETSRSISVMLTDFEENPLPIFRVATSNSPKSIKPEMLQRFEKIFFVDLPQFGERKTIFEIHLKKFGRDPKKFDVAKLAASSDSFVGREIRVAIKEAMAKAFDEGKEVTTEHILNELVNTTPMAKIPEKDLEIKAMREWAVQSAQKASKEEIVVKRKNLEV